MKKYIYILIAVMTAILVSSCGASKKAQTSQDYTVEEVEVHGYGIGISPNENTARKQAMTVALGDLSMKLQANVRTANSEYEKQTGTSNKVLFESLTEVVSENRLEGVTYKGDKSPASHKKGIYEYRVEAYINQTILRKTLNKVLDELDATEAERAAFRREMFGDES